MILLTLTEQISIVHFGWSNAFDGGLSLCQILNSRFGEHKLVSLTLLLVKGLRVKQSSSIVM